MLTRLKINLKNQRKLSRKLQISKLRTWALMTL